MKKNLFIWMAFLLAVATACTKDDVNELAKGNTVTTKAEITDILTIETDAVGQVADKIGDHLTVQKLILSGPINAADVETIRTLSNLVAIDMKNATIVGGNESYTVYDNSGYSSTYTLSDNEIGFKMFSNTQLSEIILPDNITHIESHAFNGLRGNAEYPFTEITIPDKVETIGSNAFQECNYLEKVVLPASLQEIADYTFDGCENLANVEIKSNITRIGHFAFQDCSSLQSITLPESLTTLGHYCFTNTGLTSIIIPNNVTDMGETHGDVFEGCTALQSVILPKNLTTIKTRTFLNCSSLTSIVLPETLQEIESEAFRGCESLAQIDFPSTVTYIGSSAFYDCKALQTAIFHNALNNFTINDYAFANSGLVSVTLTDNVKNVGEGCFENCTSLTSVTLHNTLTELSYGIFRGCTALESIVIPDNVITIDNYCFYGCSKLSNVTLPAMLETIGEYAFSNCTALKEIDFTKITKLKRIYQWAFYASGLINASLPEGLESIGKDAFENCTNIESITIPASISSLNERILNNTPRLTSVFWNTTAAIPFEWKNENPNCLYYLSHENIQHENVQIDGNSITNIIVNEVSENITLTPEGYFSVPKEFKAKKISYTKYISIESTRFLESSNWRSIALPFAVTSITFSDGRTLAPFNATAGDDKPFWLRRLTSNGFENVTQIEAGIPYIYALPNNSSYDSQYNFSYGTITFSAEDPNGITIPATDEMVQDVGPAFMLHANYETIPMAGNIYVLNETSNENRLYGSVFVRNERDARPFEGYVTPLSTAANAPAYFSIGSSTPITRGTKPLGPVPSIDDM